MKPLISVIMSTKDTEEKILRSAINSILNQTYRNFEFIIICDGELNDYNIVKSYKDDRIVIIKHEESVGLTKSLNEALLIAKGKYIARMDSDDISLTDRLMVQLKFMEKNQNIDICSTVAKYFGNRKDFNYNAYNDSEGIKAQLFLYNCLVHPSVMIRKSFIEKYNIKYDENYIYSQDYELWARCSKIGNIYVINKIELMYRVHNKQISTSKLDIQNGLCKGIYNKNIKEFNLKEDADKITDIIMCLGERYNKEYTFEEYVNLIEKILKCNKSSKIYDHKKLKRVLYLKLSSLLTKRGHILLALKTIMKKELILLLIKKVLLNIYFKMQWIVIKKKL